MIRDKFRKFPGIAGRSSHFEVRTRDIPSEFEKLWLIEEARSDLALATLAVRNRHIFGALRQSIVVALKHLHLLKLLRSLELEENPEGTLPAYKGSFELQNPQRKHER